MDNIDDRVICPSCGQECHIVPYDDATPYEYGSTSGIHRGGRDGLPVSHCCEADIEVDVDNEA